MTRSRLILQSIVLTNLYTKEKIGKNVPFFILGVYDQLLRNLTKRELRIFPWILSREGASQISQEGDRCEYGKEGTPLPRVMVKVGVLTQVVPRANEG